MKHLPIKVRLFGVLAALFAAMPSSAQQEETKLVIYNHAGGSPVEIPIDNVRKVTFQDTYFTMMYNDGMQADDTFAYDDVKSIKFSGIETGIGNINAEDGTGEIVISRSGSQINISGITDKVHIRLFDISGRQIFGRTSAVDTSVSTDELSEGVYILRVNNKSFKFSKF